MRELLRHVKTLPIKPVYQYCWSPNITTPKGKMGEIWEVVLQ